MRPTTVWFALFTLLAAGIALAIAFPTEGNTALAAILVAGAIFILCLVRPDPPDDRCDEEEPNYVSLPAAETALGTGQEAVNAEAMGRVMSGGMDGMELERLNIAINYLQNFGLVLVIDIPWPEVSAVMLRG